ncbi:alpha-ketoglutarate-dependent dioxygenase AlkB [Nostoc sphaeroides]|uniref:Alpha-ketoglutarate-dependent dioxygenase AlkB n=1 Tax=Nostoc sphaeroides CCNUC1 TaxID=2653204 RepID=A0A5P8WDY8_9NOSO|nr:alpha-ketoglutarate-dependent dioxygenase AlkB [Nostoc sphaeroides]QFS50864.1 alpha-ketoglutarate-dependent dioxygenase AlkB [Nostoc sphaeroides CCNUC1]
MGDLVPGQHRLARRQRTIDGIYAIASLSLGSCRKFQIKPRNGKPTDFWLEHGSLLVMHPGCQSTHLHQVPKTNKVVSTRINLTFRPHTGGGR